MPLSKEAITNAVIIYFSHKGVKLWPYEPYKKNIKGQWKCIKGRGYPPGTPDTMGWSITNGQVYGVEVKTMTDHLSKTQKDILDMMISDNCMAYVAYGTDQDNIKLVDWKSKDSEIILIDKGKVIV